MGLAILTNQLREFLSPGSTPGHLVHVQELIEQIETVPETRMSGAIQELFEQTKTRGVLMLMSDFLVDDLDELFATIRLFRHRKSEVIILHLIHPDEERLPTGTAYRFEGLENEGSIECSPGDIQTLYQQRFEAHVDSVRTLSLTNGCDYLRVSTAIPYLQTLGEFLVERSG